MEGKEDVEDGGVVYKGWVARGGEKLRDPSSCGPETCLLFFRRGT